VERISIQQVDSVVELASITGQQQIEQLVRLVLEAPLFDTENEISSGAPEFMLSFHLKDGTEVGGFFWLSSGELNPPGIKLPEEFGDAILSAAAIQ
jgi:hypothetical protein